MTARAPARIEVDVGRTPTKGRRRAVKEAMKRWAGDLFKDMSTEFVQDLIRSPLGVILLSAIPVMALQSDLAVKKEHWDKDVHMPLPSAFDPLFDSIRLMSAAAAVADVATNSDVASDIIESLYDNIFERMLTDTFTRLWDIYTPTEALDDDEIRDIIDMGALSDPYDVALSALFLGLDTWSALAEVYAGYLQGLQSYFRELVRIYEDYARDLQVAYAPKSAVLRQLVREVLGDAADAMYWFMDASSAVADYARSMFRSYIAAYVDYKLGHIDQATFNTISAATSNALDALHDVMSEIESAVGAQYGAVYSEIKSALDKTAVHASAVLGEVLNEVRKMAEAELADVEKSVRTVYGEVKRLLRTAGLDAALSMAAQLRDSREYLDMMGYVTQAHTSGKIEPKSLGRVIGVDARSVIDKYDVSVAVDSSAVELIKDVVEWLASAAST
ncbi:hypothetical protein V493_03186, partial [Pseudogymnoascus sp. VKM F-4281 (FW-2241)]